MSSFLRRAAAVGVVVNNENNAAQTAYDFLGAHGSELHSSFSSYNDRMSTDLYSELKSVE